MSHHNASLSPVTKMDCPINFPSSFTMPYFPYCPIAGPHCPTTKIQSPYAITGPHCPMILLDSSIYMLRCPITVALALSQYPLNCHYSPLSHYNALLSYLNKIPQSHHNGFCPIPMSHCSIPLPTVTSQCCTVISQHHNILVPHSSVSS